MTIRVKLFAILRDKAGVAETPIELRAGATVADAIESVAARHPDLRPYLGRAPPQSTFRAPPMKPSSKTTTNSPSFPP